MLGRSWWLVEGGNGAEMDRSRKQTRKEKALEWSEKLLNGKEDAVFKDITFHDSLG